MRIAEFAEKSNRAKSPGELLALLQREAEERGFDRYAFCALPHDDKPGAQNSLPRAVAHNYPADWIEYYFEHNYHLVDPVLLHARSRNKGFLWDSLETEVTLTSAQKLLLNQAGENGLRDGVCIPMHGANGRDFLVSFAASARRPNPGKALSHLNLLAFQFYVAYSAIEPSPVVEKPKRAFTARQYECLKLSAAGKNSQEIAGMLGIKKCTVDYHIGNAIKACGAGNRIEAAALAVSGRHIYQ